MSTKYTILMFNMSYYHDWENGIRNRNYFILHELLKRPEVMQIVAVDYLPISIRQKTRSIVSSIKCHVSGNKGIKLHVYSPILVRHLEKRLQKILDTSYLIHNTKAIPNTKLILWSYFPLYINYFDDIPADLKVFDAVDDWSAHPAYKNQKELLNINYQKILSKADVIFTVSDDLRENLFHADPKVHWIPNGVNLKVKNKSEKIKKKNLKSKVRVGYVGTIQSRVDFKLVKFIAEQHQDKQFVFVGPIWKDAEIDQVKGLSNVKFIGRVPYDKIPDYLSDFDIGIIPHKIDDFTRSMNPMKFYEYCAFGLPVVSTQKISDDSRLLYHAKTHDEFNLAINQALNDNSQELIDKRRQFARDNSWQSRVDEMMKIIKN